MLHDKNSKTPEQSGNLVSLQHTRSALSARDDGDDDDDAEFPTVAVAAARAFTHERVFTSMSGDDGGAGGG